MIQRTDCILDSICTYVLFPVHPGVCLSPRCTEPPRSHRRWFQAAGCAECRRTRRPQRGLWAVLYFLEGNSTRIKREKGQDRIMCNYCHCVTKPNTSTHSESENKHQRVSAERAAIWEAFYRWWLTVEAKFNISQSSTNSSQNEWKLRLKDFDKQFHLKGHILAFFWLWHGLQPRPRRPLIAHG